MRIMNLFLITLITTISTCLIDMEDEYVNAYQVCEYIENNIEDINKKLNDLNYEIDIKTVNSYPITIKQDEELFDGIISLFNYNEFYLLYSDNFILYDYGENFNDIYYDYLLDNNLIYSIYNEYLYFENERYHKILLSEIDLDFECFSALNEIDENGINVKGMYEANNTLADTTRYMKYVYGSSSTLLSTKSVYTDYINIDDLPRKNRQMLPNTSNTIIPTKYMEGQDQGELSAYDEIGFGSEDNCGLVAPYTVANFWLQAYHKDITSAYIKDVYNPIVEEPNVHYSKMSNPNYKLKNEDERNWPELYRKMRKICYDRYNKIEGLNVWATSTIFERTLRYYGIETNVVEEIDWDSTSIENYINKNKPLMLSISPCTDSVYKNHTMALCGYEIWKVKEDFLGFPYYRYNILYEVKDGWTKESRYFNPSTYNSVFYYVLRIEEEGMN